MVANIGWGTYLFFAAINACFLPVIWFFYPETRRRSLEEIDIIFAKGYVEKMSYVRAAKELPLLSDQEIEREALRYGLIEVGESGSKAGLEGFKRRELGMVREGSDEEKGIEAGKEVDVVR